MYFINFRLLVEFKTDRTGHYIWFFRLSIDQTLVCHKRKVIDRVTLKKILEAGQSISGPVQYI